MSADNDRWMNAYVHADVSAHLALTRLRALLRHPPIDGLPPPATEWIEETVIRLSDGIDDALRIAYPDQRQAAEREIGS